MAISTLFIQCVTAQIFDRVEKKAKEFRTDFKPPVKVFLTLFVTHFDKDGKLDERFLNFEKKYNYSGLAIFASQLVTDQLTDKRGKHNLMS